MKKTKTEKGITLVALIITIIVLLILAVVTINAVRGDGIIQYAESARDKYNSAATNEQAMLDSYIGKMEDYSPKVVHSGIVPAGAVYIKNRNWDEDSYSFNETQKEELHDGAKMPDTPSIGDIYIYGDYEYCYGCGYNPGGFYPKNVESWAIKPIDMTKSEYGDVLLSINNKPLNTSLEFAWYECTNLSKLVIPEGVKYASGCGSRFNKIINYSKFICRI